ncbi:MAG: signal peptidase [Pseudomonadota bacterium]|jgi:signal peptidase I
MRRILQEYGIVAGASVLGALVFRFMILEAYSIPGPAMKPSLLPGDQVLIWKAPFLFSNPTPRRGDIVLFAPPSDSERRYLRRVAALPGDRVAMSGGELILNGKTTRQRGPSASIDCAQESLDHQTYPVCPETPELADLPETTVPAGMVFLVADLRSPMASAFPAAGLAPIDSVLGKALWIWISLQPTSESPSLFSRLRFERIFRKVNSG